MARVRLKSLRLSGFKSFPDQVDLAFPSDVSAIIGPNGCGKSNLVDAILWVLGEQSPTILRLKQMGEVVFSGATRRSPAGAAEVVLTLNSDDGHWKETDGELEIRRRVYKSGPSEYRLNGRTARLADVRDELLSVGLGTRDYSIIEQGRVGQVLSARPTDRRALIEEAAGITRYKRRKHDAELKLEHTRQNLIRLDDVISEVDRSLRQMKRQAGQARRHQRLQDELKDTIRTLLILSSRELDTSRREGSRHRAQIENEVVAAAASLGSSEADLTQARANLETTRTEVEGARTEVADLMTSRERMEAFLERSADLIDNLRESVARARVDGTTLSSNRAELSERIDDAAERQSTLEEALATIRKTVEEATEAEATARGLLQETENQATQRRQELLRAISSLTSNRNLLGELEREQDRLSYSLEQLEHESTTLDGRLAESDARYRAAAEDSQHATAAVEELELRRRGLVERRTGLQEEARTSRNEAESLGQELWNLRHRLAGVERELARHSALSEQLTECLPSDMLDGQLSDYLSPRKDQTGLLDRVWSDWLELPVIRCEGLSTKQLKAVADLDGRLRLAVTSNAPSPPILKTPEGAESLFDHAGITAEDLLWITRILPPAFICSSPTNARSLAEQHPQAIFVGPDGVIWRGLTQEPPTAGARVHGALALRDDRQHLAAEIAAMEGRENTASALHRSLASQLVEVNSELGELDNLLLQAEQDRGRATAVEQSLGQDVSRLKNEFESVAAESERSRTQQAELSKRREILQSEVSAFETRTAELEQAVDDATASLDGHRDETAEALRRLDRWRAEERLAEERAEAARSETDRLAGEGQRLDERIAKLEADVERLTGELTRTEQEVVTSRTRLAEEQGMLASARDRERRLGENIDQVAAQVERFDKEVRQRREEHDRARESLHEVQMDLTRLDAEWNRLRESAAADLDTTPEALAQLEPDDGAEPEQLQEKIDDLRLRIDKVGPVNLLALQEVDELTQRSEFLSTQRKDLVEALRKLDATIREIDAYCTERFVTTLEQVNTVFHETFNTLFGGGSATLQLVDEDNPLESGIDITAQPPGKKTQSVQLLSGGEKALTALSLLISLFRIKPSPFCILDEVDAPLDDANVERLADLIAAMTDHTQFVLITHNRRTMARADVLYGITMEEPGVSKAVSVRIEN